MDSLCILSAPKSVAATSLPETAPHGFWFVADSENGLFRGPANDPKSLRDLSPLVLYGQESCGKSQLARVLGELYLATQSGSNKQRQKPLVTPINELDKRVRHAAIVGGFDELTDHWSSVPVWIIEDFHRFGGGQLSNQMLVRLLDERQEKCRLTIFCGRKSPWEVAGFSPRLQSRMMSGWSWMVRDAGLEARSRILTWSADRLGLVWEEESLQSVTRSRSSLRSVVEYLREFARRHPGSQTLDQSAVQGLWADREKKSTKQARSIIAATARHFGISVADLVGLSRRQSIVKARGVMICLLREMTSMTWQSIAECTGRQDHSTVLHANNKTRESFKSDRLLAEAYRHIRCVISEKRGSDA